MFKYGASLESKDLICMQTAAGRGNKGKAAYGVGSQKEDWKQDNKLLSSLHILPLVDSLHATVSILNALQMIPFGSVFMYLPSIFLDRKATINNIL